MHGQTLTAEIIGAAMVVHRRLGPGLLELTYETCLAIELGKRGLQFERQVAMPLTYEDVVVETAFRVDLLVEGHVVVELKSVAGISPVHIAQVLSYLRASGADVGLLINFNVVRLKDGVRRLDAEPGVSLRPLRGSPPSPSCS